MTLQTGDLTLQLEGHFGLYAPSFGLNKPTAAVLNEDEAYWPGKFPQQYTPGWYQPGVYWALNFNATYAFCSEVYSGTFFLAQYTPGWYQPGVYSSGFRNQTETPLHNRVPYIV